MKTCVCYVERFRPVNHLMTKNMNVASNAIVQPVMTFP